MKATEIISQLRQTFNELVKNAEVPQPPAPMDQNQNEYKLTDGTTITITEMVVGGVCMKDGQPMVAGTYTLEDGTSIVVGDNGVLMEIVAPTGQQPAQDQSQMNNQWASSIQMQLQKFESNANEKYSFYETKFKEYEERLNKATKVIEGLLNLTQTLAETPTGVADPVTKSNSMFSSANSSIDSSYEILFTK